MTEKNIGERLRSIRKEKKLTQVELANITHCSEQQISYIERGGRELSAKMAYALENALGVSHEYLLCKTDNRKFDGDDNMINREEAVNAALGIIGQSAGWKAWAIVDMLKHIGKKVEDDDS